MSLVYYPNPCEEEIIGFSCDPCADPEAGRIRHLAYIKNGFVFINPEDPAEWQDGITNGDIQIIPNVRGESDGGSDVVAPGYGDQEERIVGRKFTLKVFDNRYKGNCTFWNAKRISKSWRVAYVTDTLVHISDKIVTTKPKAPIKQELVQEIEYEIDIIFNQLNDPCPFDKPEGIFDCFQLS